MPKRTSLKTSWRRAAIAVVTLALIVTPGFVAAAPDLNERPMVKRAEEVTTLKNEFVRKVLERAGLSYEADATGFPVRVQYQQTWESIQKIEVVPLTDPTDADAGVKGHRIFFFTEDDILQIDSPLPIRK
ncbi:MAG: hypothetical protein M0P04_06140 [Syntrophales bacterium]|jgi:hypothetical protein|nr:hypothetical protein [Syntrophales bacterium]MDD4338244.1 hypothetical protein [Syntrophales bacterium]HOG06901.1 hypothetical protein [Syntrophales bacterium]HOS77349.1 hypothetical protein [Syntrophales bacterium]HPB71115.1 hypothetical protein [Syntrophales bacterium]